MLNTQQLAKNKRLIIFVTVFSLTAVIFLLAQILASANVAVFEAENTQASGATTVFDTNASNDQFVLFNASGDPVPDPDPEPDPDPSEYQFEARFESASDFYDRFVTDVGNYVDFDLHRTAWMLDNRPWINTQETFIGDHNLACEGPYTSRVISIRNIDEFFWHCNPGGDPAKGHIMTAFDTSGYAIISFSPNQTMNDITQVCWDVNSTDLGGGKWTNMVIVSENLYQQFAPRMDYVTPGFNNDNAPGDFNIQQQDHPGEVVFGFRDFRGALTLFKNDDTTWFSGFIISAHEDKAQRFTKCLTETGPNELEISVERVDGSTLVETIPNEGFPDGPVRIIFQDDMYNPPKRAGYDPNNVTWHWDNILVK